MSQAVLTTRSSFSSSTEMSSRGGTGLVLGLCRRERSPSPQGKGLRMEGGGKGWERGVRVDEKVAGFTQHPLCS